MRATQPSLDIEYALLAQGCESVAGVDEVGRGSWAGPVVAAAVILPLADNALRETLSGVQDSKLLPAGVREELAEVILHTARAVAVGWASHHVVDSLGLGNANRLALTRAAGRLQPQPEALIVDYFRLPECPLPQVRCARADSLSLSVASASILAKVFRDRWMGRWDLRVPGYGFSTNKGYGTAEHREALARLGPSRLHRRSFEPVARCRAGEPAPLPAGSI